MADRKRKHKYRGLVGYCYYANGVKIEVVATSWCDPGKVMVCSQKRGIYAVPGAVVAGIKASYEKPTESRYQRLKREGAGL